MRHPITTHKYVKKTPTYNNRIEIGFYKGVFCATLSYKSIYTKFIYICIYNVAFTFASLVKSGIISIEKEKLERKQNMLFSMKFKLSVSEKENSVACWTGP